MPSILPQLACPHAECADHGRIGAGNVTGHGYYRTRTARRRRYLCKTCDRTFSQNTATAYFGLHTSRRTFDSVARLSVEGVGVSAIARVVGRDRDTIARWLARAQSAAGRFNDHHITGYELLELQLDELKPVLPQKETPTWVFTGIEVSSRLWPATVVGPRSHANTRRLLNEVATRADFVRPPLISADGFKYYRPAVAAIFSGFCVFGQVVKTRRKNRVVKVERRLVTGTPAALKQALLESEDSEKLNTSFVERLNLTIRSATAYLKRKTLAHARAEARLRGTLDLLRCYYNFARPHAALRFGNQVRTPAWQVGLATRRLSFRDIFMWSRAGAITNSG